MPSLIPFGTFAKPSQNPPVNTTGTPLMQTPTAPDVVIKPGPNGDGNGIGVTTVPIPVSALPRTTLTYDPLATPGIGE